MYLSYGPGEKLPTRLEGAEPSVVQIGESYDASNGWPIPRWQERARGRNKMKVYVASSWRNPLQVGIVHALRALKIEVYDFRRPAPDKHGFSWGDIDSDWKNWPPEKLRESLKHPVAVAGFERDFSAMQWADCCVLVLPCGRSAHLEAGWFAGAGKPVHILMLTQEEPELMYRFGVIHTSVLDLFEALDSDFGAGGIGVS